MGYNSFIKGGLPLNSYDFVDRENALAHKSKLLVTLDKINKLHAKQMSVLDESSTQNNIALDKTIDIVNNEINSQQPVSFESPKPQVLDSNSSRLWEAPSIDFKALSEEALKTSSTTPPVSEAAQVQSQTLGNIFDFAKQDPQSNLYEAPENEPIFENNPPQESAYDTPFDSTEMGEQSEYNEIMEINNDPGEPLYVLDEKDIGTRGKKKGAEYSNVSGNDVKSGKIMAWLAYIVFFLPLLFMGKNTFVKHHANNGLCYNILDAVGIGLIFLDKIKYFQDNDNKWINLSVMIASIVGFMIIVLMALIKIISILLSWAGREVKNPVLKKFKVFK